MTIVLLILIRSSIIARDLSLLLVDFQRPLAGVCLAKNVEYVCELFHCLLDLAKRWITITSCNLRTRQPQQCVASSALFSCLVSITTINRHRFHFAFCLKEISFFDIKKVSKVIHDQILRSLFLLIRSESIVKILQECR